MSDLSSRDNEISFSDRIEEGLDSESEEVCDVADEVTVFGDDCLSESKVIKHIDGSFSLSVDRKEVLWIKDYEELELWRKAMGKFLFNEPLSKIKNSGGQPN